MKILIVCMMVHELRIAEPSTLNRIWQQQQQQQQRRQDERSSWIDDNDQLAPFVVEPSPPPPPPSPSLSPRQRKRINADSTEFGPAWIRGSARSSCSCESQYEIRDLGDGHYPRYLTTSYCKSKTCKNKFLSCRLLHYMVHVLRLREHSITSTEWYTNDNNLSETPLPESLRYEWQLKPISVAVACVPTLDSRRN